MKKRVSITVEKEPYELLQKNIKLAGFGVKWFGQEIDKLVLGLNEIVAVAVETAKQGKAMTEKERMNLIVKTAEKVFGMNLDDIQR